MAQDAIIVELEDMLGHLETAKDKCSRNLLRIDEAKKVITDVHQKLEKLLPADSTAFRIYDKSKREHTLWWKVTISRYVSKSNCENIGLWIKILREIISEYEPDFLRGERVGKKQYFLPAGDRYHAMKLVFRIMCRAQRNLAIVDQFLDDKVFDYIESLEMSVDIKLITADQKPIFRKLYNALKTKRPNIEAKVCHDCHDRFLVIDGSEIWHLGASINGVGKQASMVNKVTDSDEYKRFLSNFNTWWSNGTII